MLVAFVIRDSVDRWRTKFVVKITKFDSKRGRIHILVKITTIYRKSLCTIIKIMKIIANIVIFVNGRVWSNLLTFARCSRFNL